MWDLTDDDSAGMSSLHIHRLLQETLSSPDSMSNIHSDRKSTLWTVDATVDVLNTNHLWERERETERWGEGGRGEERGRERERGR